MSTTWDLSEPVPPAFSELEKVLDRVRATPQFGPLVTPDYQSGYSAARSDAVPIVDAGVSELLGVYVVLDLANSLFTPERLGAFLAKPLPELDGQSPLSIMRDGQSSRVLELLASEYEGQTG